MPCLSTVMPWEAWYFGRGAKPGEPSPFKWTYHFGFGVDEFYRAYVSQWNGPVKTNKKVGVLYPNDADGNAIRAHLAPLLAKQGFTIVDPGPYEDGTTDYSAQIATFKKEQCEIFNTFPIPPDFAAFWRQAAQQGYTKIVKIAQIAKTGLFASDVESLGNLGFNLASGCYWHKAFPYKSSLTGISGAAARRRLREGVGQAVDPAARRDAVSDRRRLRGAQACIRSEEEGCRRQVAVTVEHDDDRRQGRFHQRAGSQRVHGADYRHAVGQGSRGQQVQARLRHHRERHRSDRSGPGESAALQLKKVAICLR